MPSLAQLLHDSPLCALDSHLLMMRVMGYTRVQLLTRDTDVLTQAQHALWQQLLARRVAGEPMAYILGEREFYGRTFTVNPSVLIPRPDTEVLIDAVLTDYPSQHISLIDLGTGSGAIAITLAAERTNCDWQVCATDVSAEALLVALNNAKRLNTAVDFFEGNWWQAVDADSRWDVVVSNPPYIEANNPHLRAGDVRFEPIGALTDGADGLQHYRAILRDARQHLRPNGAVYFEHGFDQGEAVRALLLAAGFGQVRTLKDLAGHERVSTGVLCHDP